MAKLEYIKIWQRAKRAGIPKEESLEYQAYMKKINTPQSYQDYLKIYDKRKKLNS